MYLWGVVCVFRGGYMYACGVFLRVVGVFVCVLCALNVIVRSP